MGGRRALSASGRGCPARTAFDTHRHAAADSDAARAALRARGVRLPVRARVRGTCRRFDGLSLRSGLPSPRPAQAPTGRNLRAFAASRACRNATPAPHAADWRVEAPEGAPVPAFGSVLLGTPVAVGTANAAATDGIRVRCGQAGGSTPKAACWRPLVLGYCGVDFHSKQHNEKKKNVQKITREAQALTRVRSDPVTPPASPRAPARPEQSGGAPCRTRARARARPSPSAAASAFFKLRQALRR